MKTPNVQTTLDPSNNSHPTNRPPVNTKLRYEFLTTVMVERWGGVGGRGDTDSPCLANDGECRGNSEREDGGGGQGVTTTTGTIDSPRTLTRWRMLRECVRA